MDDDIGYWRLDSGLLTYVIELDDGEEISATIREIGKDHYNIHLEVDIIQDDKDIFGDLGQAKKEAVSWAIASMEE